SGMDKPFLGYATGLYPATDTQFPGYGINNTIFRASAAGAPNNSARLFQVPYGDPSPDTTPPYKKYDLFQKLFNNITTRSNVFGVWLTVGYFEVIDKDAANNPVNPPVLGAELGLSTGTNVRHRFFAIVDRTNLLMPANAATVAAGPSNLPAAIPAIV